MNDLVFVDDGGMIYCRPCNRWFKDHCSVLQHLVHSNMHDYGKMCDQEFVDYIEKNQHIANSSSNNICGLQVCRNHYSNGGDFHSRAALLEHFREDRDHHYCFTCEQDFDSDQQRRQHWSCAKNHYICEKCNDSFGSQTGLRQHYEESPEHFLCYKCDYFCHTQYSLHQHFAARKNHHWCTRCQRDFVSDAALLQHWQSSSLHFLCRVCKRDFSCTNELVQHQKIHQPRSITCACPMTFACFSALVIHWEAGKCTTNRQFLNKLILSYPEHRRFTVLDCINHLNGIEDRVREADDQDYNCYVGSWLCPIEDCQCRFPSSIVLDQHLNSPYHDLNAFKCPNVDCDARFSCLSGLLQHVANSGRCDEGINRGTGCLGRLWLFLLERFNMLPEKEDVFMNYDVPSPVLGVGIAY